MTMWDIVYRRLKLLVIFWQCLDVLQSSIAHSERREYCQYDFFNVSCSPRTDTGGEVILMDSAQYGRMRAGRCVSTNVGCSVDVLEFFDRQCSGRRACAVYVSDPALHKLAPCSKDFTSYLEAKYTCLPVTNGCSRNRHVTSSGKTFGYFASVALTEGGYGTGTGSCSWKIEAEPGQTIRLSLLSFGVRGLAVDVGQGGGSEPGPDACYEIGELREAAIDRPTAFSMCSESSRENVFFVSTGSDVTVQLKPPEVLKGLAPFIVKYEVRGCRPLKAPAGGFVKIDGHTATVRCNESKETWFLTCAGNVWLGHIGNCSDKASGVNSHGDVASLVEENFPYGILLVVAIGVALGVLIGGVLLSCVAYYMKRQTRLHGYAEPSEWTKQMLDEMEAYNEAKQLAASSRYIHEAQSSTAVASATPSTATAAGASVAIAVATPNRTVDRTDFNATAIGHVRGCTCPRDDDDYTTNNDCRLVLSTGGATGVDVSQSRFLYEIPQFKN